MNAAWHFEVYFDPNFRDQSASSVTRYGFKLPLSFGSRTP